MTQITAVEPSVPLQVHLQRADGSTVTCLLVAAPISYERRPALSAQFVDISEEVRLRDVAARAVAADLGLEVAAGVAHDFNNIFTGLLGYLDLAAGSIDAATTEGPYVQSALVAARRAATLTRALRDYSNSATLSSAAVRADEVVRLMDVGGEAYMIMRAAIDRRVTMVVHPRREAVYVTAPSDTVMRVLVNLLVNARDAALERAATAGPNYHPGISLSVEADAAEGVGVGVVIVNDNGTGIPKEIAERGARPRPRRGRRSHLRQRPDERHDVPADAAAGRRTALRPGVNGRSRAARWSRPLARAGGRA